MAPREDLITPLGWELINDLPPAVRDDPDYRAIMHCAAKEVELLEAAIESARDQMSPFTALDAGLRQWEVLLHVPTHALDPVEVRRNAVVRRHQALLSDPSGLSWISRITLRIGTTWTYEGYASDDPSSPDPQNIRVHLPYTPGTAAWNAAVAVFEVETPTEQVLEFVSDEGFILDESRMDVEGMGV